MFVCVSLSLSLSLSLYIYIYITPKGAGEPDPRAQDAAMCPAPCTDGLLQILFFLFSCFSFSIFYCFLSQAPVLRPVALRGINSCLVVIFRTYDSGVSISNKPRSRIHDL